MSSLSRNYILARRGVGIADLRSMTLENGDMDLDQAEAFGVCRVNSTHQVGIATSTEIGLSADRFPIRVIIAAQAADIPAPATDTVCSYWRVVTAAGAAIPYTRRPLQTDITIKNLYKACPDLDSTLWAACDARRGSVTTVVHNTELDAVAQTIYDCAQLVAPNAAQYTIIANGVAKQMADCATANIVPYLKLAENAYLLAEPHGREYQAMGTASATKVALHEMALCMVINYNRLKARYDDLPDGTVALAAYTIASMFRHGLAESYEHKEYFTAVMAPVAGSAHSFTVQQIRAPRGTQAPADLATGQTVDVSKVRLKKNVVEISNLMVVCSGLMHYLFNHSTGGTMLTGALLTILSMYQYVTSEMPAETHVHTTSLIYEAVHPSNKRAIANIFFKNSLVTTHGRCATFPKYEKFALDSFAQIRAQPYPAGSHKAFICLQAMKRVLASGLGPFLPWASQITSVIDMCQSVLKGGARAHIGSNYYTGAPPVVQPASIDQYLPELASYVHIFNRGDSLSMSPHLADDIARRANMNWQNLLRDLRAKDVSATSADVVREFLATSGAVHFTFDPADQTTWGKAVSDANIAAQAIDAIFT